MCRSLPGNLFLRFHLRHSELGRCPPILLLGNIAVYAGISLLRISILCASLLRLVIGFFILIYSVSLSKYMDHTKFLCAIRFACFVHLIW